MEADKLLIVDDNRDRVGRNKVVRLRYRVTEAANSELLEYGDGLFYLHGGYGGAFPKVERAMEGRRVGDALSLTLTPEEGYGHRDPSLVLVLPREEFEEHLPETGAAVEGQLPGGESMIFTVAEVSQGRVTLDGNHPFAGKQLRFDFEVLEIRDSIEAERSAGFAFDGMFC